MSRVTRSQSPGRRERRGSTSPEHSRRTSGGGTLVIQKTVRDVGGSAPYPQLTCTNYDSWVVMMKVMLEACGLWGAVETGTTECQEDRWAMEAILRAVPLEMHQSLGANAMAKKAWDNLKKMRTGAGVAKWAKIQQLRREYELLEFKDGEGVEDFTLPFHPSDAVEGARPNAGGLDLETLTFEDVVGQFRV
ncbi:hypothetical protein U9M48_019555 [Paspalum notatum var. saurae]|uniref:DUF4219 domain-containing protein n=1 Tax=Paspalum notatum var. saurae TaxID=547442 RepID=A0AAQ3WRM6_PASNO